MGTGIYITEGMQQKKNIKYERKKVVTKITIRKLLLFTALQVLLCVLSRKLFENLNLSMGKK